MITIIMLTSIALIVLLIGFFEIRIPFIHQDALRSKKKATILPVSPPKTGKTGININMKTFFKNAKNEVSYRIIQNRKTSDIA